MQYLWDKLSQICLNRPYAYDVTEGRPGALGVKRGTATCAIAKHAASGPTPACHTARLARARALTERLSANALCQHNTCAQRNKSWPPTWRCCYGDVTSMHKVYPLALISSRGYYLETNQDPIAMVIRVKLFTHKPSETNTNWHCMVTIMHDYVTGVFCLQGLWMNSWTLNYHGNWVWVGFEIIPPGWAIDVTLCRISSSSLLAGWAENQTYVSLLLYIFFLPYIAFHFCPLELVQSVSRDIIQKWDVWKIFTPLLNSNQRCFPKVICVEYNVSTLKKKSEKHGPTCYQCL